MGGLGTSTRSGSRYRRDVLDAVGLVATFAGFGGAIEGPPSLLDSGGDGTRR